MLEQEAPTALPKDTAVVLQEKCSVGGVSSDLGQPHQVLSTSFVCSLHADIRIRSRIPASTLTCIAGTMPLQIPRYQHPAELADAICLPDCVVADYAYVAFLLQRESEVTGNYVRR